MYKRQDGGTAGVDQADTVDHLLHTQGSDEGLDLQVADHEACLLYTSGTKGGGGVKVLLRYFLTRK